jgi:hypothetical protein
MNFPVGRAKGVLFGPPRGLRRDRTNHERGTVVLFLRRTGSVAVVVWSRHLGWDGIKRIVGEVCEVDELIGCPDLGYRRLRMAKS